MKFLAVFLSVTSLLAFYHFKLMHRLFPQQKRFVTVTSFIMIVLAIISVFIPRFYPNAIIIQWAAGTIAGFLVSFIIYHLIFDFFLFIAGQRSSKVSSSRRDFFRYMSLGIFSGSAVTAIIGLEEVWAGANVKRVSIKTKERAKGISGLRIAQISDLHVGMTIRRAYVQDVVTKTMSTKPDIIVITGDIADGRPEELRSDLEPLAELHAPLGVFYITGNHEYYWGAPSWMQQMQKFGFHVLENENRVVSFQSRKILIAGVPDEISNIQNVELASVNTEDVDYKILLAHRPETCELASKCGFDLQLSGHVHGGGQFAPFQWIVRLARKYTHGYYDINNLSLYVNAGTGYWGPPNRFLNPSEISVIELV